MLSLWAMNPKAGPPRKNPGPWAEASRDPSYRAVTGPYYVDNVDIRGPAGPCRAPKSRRAPGILPPPPAPPLSAGLPEGPRFKSEWVPTFHNAVCYKCPNECVFKQFRILSCRTFHFNSSIQFDSIRFYSIQFNTYIRTHQIINCRVGAAHDEQTHIGEGVISPPGLGTCCYITPEP